MPKNSKKKDTSTVEMLPAGLPECWVWKAFVCFDPEKTDELRVDVSGDDFSLCPEDAIRFAYQNLGDRLTDLIGAGVIHLLVGGEPVEVQPDEQSIIQHKIILLAEKFNDSREFKNVHLGGTPGKDLSVVLALKKIPGMVENGMEVHMTQYAVQNITVESKTKSLGPDNVAVTKFSAIMDEERDENSIFPERIFFSVPFSKKDTPLNCSTEWLPDNIVPDEDAGSLLTGSDKEPDASVTQF